MNKPSRVRMSGPLVAHRRGFTTELMRQGYSPFTAVSVLHLTAHLSRWLERQGLDAGDLTGECVERYLAARRASGQVRRLTPRGLRPLLSLSARIGSHSAAGGADGCDTALAVARCVHRLSASAAGSRAAHRRRLPAIRPDLPVRTPRGRQPRPAASGASGAERLHARSIRTAQCRLAQQHGHRIECLDAIPVCARRHRAIARRRGPTRGPAIPGSAEAGSPRCRCVATVGKL